MRRQILGYLLTPQKLSVPSSLMKLPIRRYSGSMQVENRLLPELPALTCISMATVEAAMPR